MDLLTTVLTALALSMDALAVSVCNGIAIPKLRPWHVIKTALFFGFFQMLMPIIGWLVGISVRDYIVAYDHIIAFVLLGGIGIKMIWDTLKPEKEDEASNAAPSDPTQTKTLLLLAVATSIDALAVGISLAVTRTNIWISAAIIGVVTFIVCSAGVVLGKKLGSLFQRRAGLIGGIVLIGIGVKILVEHIIQGI